MTSIILNFNKNLENSDAFKYSQFFDNNINIPENASISLNNCQLTRNAIVLENDSDIKLLFNNLEGDSSIVLNPKEYTLPNAFPIDNLTLTIPKGVYDKRDFLNTIYNQTNGEILAYNDTRDFVDGVYLPYKPFISNKENKAVYGLTFDYNMLSIITEDNPDVAFDGSFHFHNDERMENNMIYDESNPSIPPVLTFANPAVVSQTDFTTFAFAQSGFNMMNLDKNNLESSSLSFGIYDLLFGGATTGNHKYVVCFTNQVNASNFSSGGVMDKQTLQPVGIDVPKAYIGIVFNKIYSATTNESINEIIIYQSDNLATFSSEKFNIDAEEQLGNMVPVATIQLSDLNLNQRFSIQFYQENIFNSLDTKSYRNYYRVLSGSLQTGTTSIIQPNDNVLFDSKLLKKNISNDLIVRTFSNDFLGGFNEIYASGLVPCFVIGGTQGATATDEGFYDIKAPFINDGGPNYNNANTAYVYAGVFLYSILLNNSLVDIFGSDTFKKLNPNASTDEEYHTSDYCVPQFYLDNTSYNIQIDDLPIKTYQSVSVGDQTNCNIGTKKPIIMKVNNLFEGSVSNINTSRLVKSHYENYPKKIQLNNKYKIDLNTLNVSIRRSKSNELASEIVDASIEITIE